MKHLTLLLVLLLTVLHSVSAANVKDDLSLTKQQKLTLEKFKKRVIPKLEIDYMKQDTYLLRWLRARNFDAGRAEEMLMTSLKWRANDKIDGIHDEDWSLFKSEYPYEILHDKEGRPVVLFRLGLWDIRKAALSGQRAKLNRYYNKILDEATLELIEMQRQGRNVTRWLNIFDMDKLNSDQHLAVPCFPFYTAAVVGYESYYPVLADKIVLINSPGIFEVVLNLVRPVMTQDTRQALVVYGKNRQEWKAKISAWIDTKQIPQINEL